MRPPSCATTQNRRLTSSSASRRGGRALPDDLPLVHHVDAVGDLERQVIVLLDEQDGEPLALEPRTMRPISRTTMGASPSDGSSSSSIRPLVMSARPMASICCSPPESVPAGWRCALAAGAGTARIDALERPLSRPRAQSEVLAHRSAARRSAAPGARAPARAARCGTRARPARLAPSKTMRPSRGGVKPATLRISGRLAGAVAPEERHGLARPPRGATRRAGCGSRRSTSGSPSTSSSITRSRGRLRTRADRALTSSNVPSVSTSP